ncbi:DcrB-related protein [Erwinia tracheiphila]|uniref:DUF1795 domain-containing protein n=1 Tax=Erwinia tracheiphila TaxID=65700 RepID=A0A0M2KGD1_9GAMM|nr:DcrB-related protein [Erwinia tracheiphila]EOS92584.1 hypothetical protein ETR_23709 [Erwinia tracheiphila PSU-1]KKF34269.1 hypothetical protein SY86_25140 [Erwinia tracheiphila]KKF36387.1 hypothetical protein SY86_14550 [Erwinia tracheiphila]UIA87717.1 DcrB-related protein [Erwinia tracheiphila]UIA89299.1 DcrB-related protein [Erwinia tracheiphila]
MRYQLNEGIIQLPENWNDETLNAFSAPDKSGLNLVITRQGLPFGTDKDEFLENILTQYREQLPGYTEDEYKTITLAAQNACLLAYHWQSDEGRIDQLAVMLYLNDVLLSFTASSASGMSKKQKETLLGVIQSFNPESTD